MQEYQGPTVALVLSGVVVMTLMYLDKHYGDNVEAAEAASAAGSPRRAAKAVAKADSAADQADLPRLKTENLSAAVEEAQLSPCVITSLKLCFTHPIVAKFVRSPPGKLPDVPQLLPNFQYSPQPLYLKQYINTPIFPKFPLLFTQHKQSRKHLILTATFLLVLIQPCSQDCFSQKVCW